MNNNNSDYEPESGLNRYLDIFLRRRWVALSVWLSAIIVTALITFNIRPVFRASALLVIEKELGNNMTDQGGPMLEGGSDDYYQTQCKLIKSEALLKVVYERLSPKDVSELSGVYGYSNLISAVTVVPVPRSRLVYVNADSYSPRLSAKIANTVTEVFIEQNLSNYESLPAVVNNVRIRQLNQKFSNLQGEIAEVSWRYTPKHPRVLSMTTYLQSLQKQIKTETDKVIKNLKKDLSGRLTGNNIRLIDAAVPPLGPIKPRKIFNILLAVIGGMILGFCAAVLVEFIDQSVRTQGDVEGKTGLTFLGAVPFVSQVKNQSPYNHLLLREHSPISGSIRNLFTMVDFAKVGGKGKALVITSSVQGEGKTYIASNLAAAIAQAERKVLIVDGDLRHSALHKVFRLSNSKGLSDFLAGGSNADDLRLLIQSTDVKNLSVLTCGPRPPNPAELLNTPRLSALLTWACEDYDYVIVDCSPIFPASDTLLLGKHVNNCIFVTVFGKTRIPLIKTAVKQMLDSGLNVLGMVVNMSKFGGSPYSSHASHHGPEKPKTQEPTA